MGSALSSPSPARASAAGIETRNRASERALDRQISPICCGFSLIVIEEVRGGQLAGSWGD